MTGLVLGKFMPPHRGHLYLLNFAKSFCEKLYIVVGSLADEPIPGELRFEWMSELFPQCTVRHLTDENPQHPDEDPDFWEIWKTSLERVVPETIDYLFCSESYGARLAEVLGASFVPTNGMRELLDLSGTKVRQEPYEHWQDIPSCVQAHYVRKVVFFGPESTGKTTLSRRLATRFGASWVPEYARTLFEEGGHALTLPNMDLVVRGQVASESAMARSGKSLMFCDTCALTTHIWSEELFSQSSDTVRRLGASAQYELTLLLTPEVPWEAGSLRLRPDNQEAFFERCQQSLEELNRSYAMVSGSCWEERENQAIKAIEALLRA